MKNDRRLQLGSMCMFKTSFEMQACIVVGTWRYTKATGMPNLTITRIKNYGNDPRIDENSDGYLILYAQSCLYDYVPWGDVDDGYLKKLP